MGFNLESRVCTKCNISGPGAVLQFRLNNYKKDITSSTYDFPGLTLKSVTICNNCVKKERIFNIKLGAFGFAVLISLSLILWHYGPRDGAFFEIASGIGFLAIFSSFYVLMKVLKYLIMTKKTANSIREKIGEECLGDSASSFGDGFFYELIIRE